MSALVESRYLPPRHRPMHGFISPCSYRAHASSAWLANATSCHMVLLIYAMFPVWLCLRGPQMGDYATQEGLEQILARLMQLHQPQAQPTASSIIDKLPRLQVPPGPISEPLVPEPPVQEGEGDDPAAPPRFACVSPGEACTICHDCFVPKEQVIELPCNHCFHESCITPWLKEVSQRRGPECVVEGRIEARYLFLNRVYSSRPRIRRD